MHGSWPLSGCSFSPGTCLVVYVVLRKKSAPVREGIQIELETHPRVGRVSFASLIILRISATTVAICRGRREPNGDTVGHADTGATTPPIKV